MFKITSETVPVQHKTITRFYANGVVVAILEVRSEYFCSVKNGKRSSLRDKLKKAKGVYWDYNNLRTLFTEEQYKKFNFKITPPDLTWGYAGDGLTKKELQKRMNEV